MAWRGTPLQNSKFSAGARTPAITCHAKRSEEQKKSSREHSKNIPRRGQGSQFKSATTRPLANGKWQNTKHTRQNAKSHKSHKSHAGTSASCSDCSSPCRPSAAAPLALALTLAEALTGAPGSSSGESETRRLAAGGDLGGEWGGVSGGVPCVPLMTSSMLVSCRNEQSHRMALVAEAEGERGGS